MLDYLLSGPGSPRQRVQPYLGPSGAIQTAVQGTLSFRVKPQGLEANHPPPSSAEAKKYKQMGRLPLLQLYVLCIIS
jgi:hypothetical protein